MRPVAPWIALGITMAMVFSCSAKAVEFDDVRINTQICNYVESASAVSAAKIDAGFDDDAINAWADHEIANYQSNTEMVVAWSMVREATAFIRKQYDSADIDKLAKSLTKYTKVELVALRMKQLCAANEIKGTVYKVPKQLSTKGFDS